MAIFSAFSTYTLIPFFHTTFCVFVVGYDRPIMQTCRMPFTSCVYRAVIIEYGIVAPTANPLLALFLATKHFFGGLVPSCQIVLLDF